MNLKLLLVLFTFLIGHKASALYGSQPAPKGMDSFIATLRLNDSDKSVKNFCSAILISPARLITAGHCIEGIGSNLYDTPMQLIYRPKLVEVVIGKEVIRAKSITLAEKYFEYYRLPGEDLAIIELSRKVTSVQPIALAAASDLKRGVTLRLLARGRVAQTTLKSFTHNDGALILKTDGRVSGVCQGDSGGALLLKKNDTWLLAGVLGSQSEGCVREDSLSFFPKMNL